MIIDDHVHVHEWSFQKGDREFEVDYVVELMDAWEVHKYGGGIRCNTMQLVRAAGPCTFGS
jgi:hypothetical protein